jgi:hypothetical protein
VRKHRATIVIIVVVVLFAVIAWLASDKDGRNESQREPLGTPLSVKLEFAKTPVTIAATEVRRITAEEFADGGFERWERFYGIELGRARVWAARFAVVRGGDGEIDPFTLGASNWSVVTNEGERIHASWARGATLPCAPADTWTEPSLTSCAFFIVPEGDAVTEVQFTGVDRSSTSRRQIGPIERYVTWTVEP